MSGQVDLPAQLAGKEALSKEVTAVAGTDTPWKSDQERHVR